jgi:hypothetical protein
MPLASFALLLLTATALLAQFNLGTITGTVLDPSGGAVAGCKVTVVNLTDASVRTAKTNSNGLFTVASLAADAYRVTVEAEGFQKAEARLNVRVDQTVNSDFRLVIGSVSEQVQVTEQAAQLQVEKDSHTISQLVAIQDLQDLPVNGRSFVSIADLTVGAGRSSDVTSGPMVTFGTQGNEVVLAGQLIGSTHFLQDGVVNMNILTATANIVPSIESIQEVNLESSGMSAKFPSPGLVNVISKRGGNAIHGVAYDYLSNDFFNARNFFAAAKPSYRNNQYGANLGTPIVKNKLFAFFDYSGQQTSTANVVRARIPTAAEQAGNFGATTIYDPSTYSAATGTISPFPNNTIPSARISSFATQYLRYYLPANTPLVGGINFNANLPTKLNPETYLGRLDYNLSSRDTLSGQIQTAASSTVGNSFAPELDLANDKSGLNAYIQDIHVFSPSVVSIARFGYNRSYIIIAPAKMGTQDYAQLFGLKNLTLPKDVSVPPVATISGITAAGGPTYPMGSTGNLFQYADEVNWSKGKHQFFFGVEVDRVQLNGLWGTLTGGSYSFNGLYTSNHLTGTAQKLGPGVADFLLGFPSSAIAAQGVPAAAFRSSNIAGYAQDTWRLSRKLTLNLGLRYEYYGPPTDKWGKAAIYNLPINTYQLGAWPADYRNFGPRVGFAYALGEKTVIRSGFGLYYNTEPYQFLMYMVEYPPAYVLQSITSSILTPVPVTDIISAHPGASGLSPETMGLRMPTPYVEQWNFSVQHSFSTKLLATVAYVGNRSHHQALRLNPNQALPDADPTHPTTIQSRRPYPFTGDVTAQYNIANATYDSMQATLRYRLTAGFTAQANYSWSKALGLADGGITFPADAHNIKGSYGLANFDRAQTFNASFSYELPIGAGKPVLGKLGWVSKQVVGGWNVSGIAAISTGPPFEVTALDTSNTGGVHTVPADRICDGNLPSAQRSIQHWFDTSCFVQPGAGRIGNEGRNVLRGPGSSQFDISAYKRFPFGEKRWVQLRADFFNALCHSNFAVGAPSSAAMGAQAISQSTYGQLVYAYPPRNLMLSLKLAF